MIRVGVIGYGYWGPNLVRNFVECPDIQVAAVADLNEARLQHVRQRYPRVEVTTDYRTLLANPTIHAVAISTPVSTHFPLAMAALEAGKHVLVEKPMAANSEQALGLIEEAERRKLVLMVDHTFVYTGAVRKIRELIERGALGDIYYYDSTRVNLGLFQHDVDVIWDLAVHDLSILEFILPDSPIAVSATGVGHVQGAAENIAYMTAFYESSLIVHLNVNWLSPVKIRRTLIGGSRQMLVYDDLESSEKIKLYDKGITVRNNPESLYKLLVGYRSGDMYCPQLDVTEALRVELQHFAECIDTGKTPITDGWSGLRVVSVLEAATLSMKEKGRSITLKEHGAARTVCA
ncbi:MAG: Gfo/Idh/MocA family oxidoreductase [Acidobacteriaceae bacterium]|nr:Gfo/Idh/MocA family oxidoreductase [Acidobacteriaceae bacterium]